MGTARPLSRLDAGAAPELIDRAFDSLERAGWLAFDTEGASFHRYRERVCLIQISTAGEDLIVDPLALGLPPRLAARIEDPTASWVLHGGDFDVLSMRRDFGVGFGRLFDTGIAARFLGAAQTGLVAILAEHLGVSIDKDEQRSDWSRRPLSESQIEYASRDTRYLIPLAEVLRAELVDIGRLEWCEEECDALRRRVPAERPPDPDAWRKIKGVRELGDRGQRAARDVHAWREAEAARRDRAPFRVLGNEAIVAIARAAETGLEDLHRLRGVPSRMDLRPVIAAIRRGAHEPVERPAPSPRKPGLDGGAKRRLERLRALRAERASALGLDAGFLLPTAVLERIAAEPPPSDALSSLDGMGRWRAEAVGEALARVL